MKVIAAAISILNIISITPFAAAQSAPAPALGVSFVQPVNGATVAPKIKIKMNVKGLKVAPVGEAISKSKGHHHLIVNGTAIPAGQVVPADATHIHFGKGQTETELELPPGKHTLTLQFADGAHISYGPLLSETIEVNVK